MMCALSASSQTYTINQGGTVNTCSGNFYDSGGAGGNYSTNSSNTMTFCAPAGQYLKIDFTSFSLGGVIPADELKIYDGASVGSPLLGSFTSTTSPGAVYSSTMGGCLTFVFTSGFIGASSGWAATISCQTTPPPPPPLGNDCSRPRPFCTGTTYSFPNNTGMNGYGGMDCLGSTPNPVWYFMRIATAGNIDIHMHQEDGLGLGIDVDYALWGPYTDIASGCANIFDPNRPPVPTGPNCSYSGNADEDATITGAQVGEYYILLLTNYADESGTIEFSQTGGTGATDCTILCTVDNMTATASTCNTSNNTYSASGTVSYSIPPTTGTLNITNSCGGTPLSLANPWQNPQPYTFAGLQSNGATCTVTATFSDVPTCTYTQYYTAPASCAVTPPCGVSAANNGPVCAGSGTTVNLTATQTQGTGVSYAWSGPGGFTSSTQNPTNVSPPATAGTYTYTVTATASGGVTCSASTSVTVNSAPTATISGTLNHCAGSNTTITANGGTGYLWSTSATTASIPATAGTYTVTVSNANACTATATATVTQNPAPTVTITGALSYCSGNTTITANGGTGYLWNTSATTPSITATAGTYTVTVTDANTCTATATATVTQNSNPTANITGNLSYCAGSNTTLTASGGASYLWSNSSTSPSITVTAGTYSVTATIGSGCSATASVTVIENPNPTATINGSLTYCTGNTTITASGGTDYAWSNGINVAANTVTAGTYTVTVSDANLCSATASATVTQTTSLNPTITGDLDYCVGGSTTIFVNGGTSYLWSNAETSSSINVFAGTYSVTATDAGGCSGTASATVIENPAPTAAINGTPIACAGGTTVITASGGIGYLWSNGTTTTSTTVSEGNYTVTVTDLNGCTASQTYTVLAAQAETYSATATGTSCYGSQYLDGTITVMPLGLNRPYQYSTDSGRVYTFDTIFYNFGAGTHTIYAKNASGCVSSFTVVVPQPAPATATINPNDSSIQIGESIVLYSSLSPQNTITSYHWSPTEGLSCGDCPNPTVTSYQRDNEYQVTITYNGICEATASATIEVTGDGIIYIPNAFSPNGDGVNDVFEIYGKFLKTSKLKVFNRWGEKVYDSMNNPFAQWDGRYKGVLQPPMIYTYEAEIEFLNDKTKRQMGSLTLVR